MYELPYDEILGKPQKHSVVPNLPKNSSNSARKLKKISHWTSDGKSYFTWFNRFMTNIFGLVIERVFVCG